MYDTTGDGWQGASWKIYNSTGSPATTGEGSLLVSGSLSDGFSGFSWICLSNGCYEIVCGGGAADSEIGFEFIDAEGGHFQDLSAPYSDHFCVTDGGWLFTLFFLSLLDLLLIRWRRCAQPPDCVAVGVQISVGKADCGSDIWTDVRSVIIDPDARSVIIDPDVRSVIIDPDADAVADTYGSDANANKCDANPDYTATDARTVSGANAEPNAHAHRFGYVGHVWPHLQRFQRYDLPTSTRLSDLECDFLRRGLRRRDNEYDQRDE